MARAVIRQQAVPSFHQERAMDVEKDVLIISKAKDAAEGAAAVALPAPSAGLPAPRVAFRMEPLGAGDGDRMLRFLRRFFFRDEPLNVAVQLLGPQGDQPCIPLEDYCLESLKEPYSLAAVCPSTGELLGVCLNGSNARGHVDEALARAEACPHAVFRQILRLLAQLEVRADLFERFPSVERVMEVRVLSVDGRCRGAGIATALIAKTREMAREQGFPLVRCDCTSAFSARAVERLGFRPVASLSYDQYLGSDGRPVFTPAAPHTQISCYVYEM